jgi:ADP-heptose:LPS heptosyltransferase
MSPGPALPAAGWAQARRVLAVRLDNLGDVLMTTPALAAVRQTLPQVHLALLAAPSAAALRPHLSDVDEVIAFDAPWVKAGAQALAEAGQPPGSAELALVDRLRQARFDAAVIFTVCTQSALPAALLCRLAGIPLVLAHSRERAYGLLSHEVRDTDAIAPGLRHEVRRQLDLVAHVGLHTADERLRLALRPQDHAAAHEALQAAGVDPAGAYVLLHPGASAASRRYPAEAFGAAADLLQREGLPVVLCAGPGEQALLQAVAAAVRGPRHVLPTLPGLGALAAVVAGAQVLVANNSGPVHVAAAVGTPVVDLYALTNPQHTPWQVPAAVLNRDVPCRNCLQSVCPQPGHPCLQGVPPAEVAAAVQALRPRLAQAA